jgi:hypothetical protein
MYRACRTQVSGQVCVARHPGPQRIWKLGVEKTAGKPGDRERAEPSERDDPFTYRNTYHIITFYRAVTARCRAAAEAEPRTDI